MKVKPLNQSVTNYENASSDAGRKYREGIEGTDDWQEKASSDASEVRYAEGVRKAVAQKRRQKGVKKVSNSEWKQRSIEKGGASISEAMRLSKDKWGARFKPFHDALNAMQLPDKVADPMANIDNRLKPVVKKMIEVKENQ